MYRGLVEGLVQHVLVYSTYLCTIRKSVQLVIVYKSHMYVCTTRICVQQLLVYNMYLCTPHIVYNVK